MLLDYPILDLISEIRVKSAAIGLVSLDVQLSIITVALTVIVY